MGENVMNNKEKAKEITRAIKILDNLSFEHLDNILISRQHLFRAIVELGYNFDTDYKLYKHL